MSGNYSDQLYGRYSISVVWNLHISFHSHYTVYNFYQQCIRIFLSLYPSLHLFLFFFNEWHFLNPNMVWIYIYQWVNDIQHFLECLFAIGNSPFENSLFSSILQYVIVLFVLLMVSFWVPLSILGNNCLLGVLLDSLFDQPFHLWYRFFPFLTL